MLQSKTVNVTTGEDQLYQVQVCPDTTAGEILTRLNLPPDFWLSPQNGLQFGKNEPIFSQVANGERLFTSPPAEVGEAQ